MNTRDLYKKYCNGDSLTDEEVRVGEVFFRELADKLFDAGPAFEIMAKEASRVNQSFFSYRRAREEKK